MENGKHSRNVPRMAQRGMAGGDAGLCGRFVLIALLALLCGGIARAVGIDQAKPGELPSGHPAIEQAAPAAQDSTDAETQEIISQDRTAFSQQIKLDDLRLLEVLHKDQVKILDSWARQSLSAMMHHQSWEGQDPLYTALDMAFRPEAWEHEKIIFVQAVPIRETLTQFATGPTEEARQLEQQRILHTGMVSPDFLARPEVLTKLRQIAASDVRLGKRIDEVAQSLETFEELPDTLLIVPPAAGTNETWMHPAALEGNLPQAAATANSGKPLPPVPGYDVQESRTILFASQAMFLGWRHNDVAIANKGIALLAEDLPVMNPHVYRSAFTRNLELWYNRLFNGTLLAGSLYFIAMTLFLMGAVGVSKSLHPWAMGFFSTALAVHILATAVRWWLAWRIPIQNEFESVLGAAMLGCVVGYLLELWKRNNLFGMAMSFVGWLAMMACFAVPFVFGKSIGESIGQVAGVLGTYWLYIHVDVVISSYALIGASFALGSLYLGVKLWHWINPIEQPAPVLMAAHGLNPSSDATAVMTSGGGGGGQGTAQIAGARALFLEQLDAANVVVLQLVFWTLGTGIACGAIWADHSWGRPWGWDPKETFALVTWIVYLIIVHLRFVTGRNKAMWTAALSVVGFGVMMFNWIGVNFWLAGLHSYA